MEHERRYSVRVDGFEICQITLEQEQFKTQFTRDQVRRDISATYKIPMHYIRLCWIEDYFLKTNLKTGITKRIKK